MEIPNEAYRAMSAGMNVHPAEVSRALGTGFDAAAPIIARAAQVAILREMAEKLERRARMTGSFVSMTGYEPSAFLRAKADELERGER